MLPPETPLEQAARHVREGQARLTAQEAVVRRLERDGSGEVLASARAALAQLHDFQIVAADRFGQELRKMSSGRQGADTPSQHAAGPRVGGVTAPARGAGPGPP